MYTLMSPVYNKTGVLSESTGECCYNELFWCCRTFRLQALLQPAGEL